MKAKANLDSTEVIRLYRTGMSALEIGRIFGVSKQPVLSILRSAGVDRRKTNVIENKEEKRDQTVRLYLQGLSIPKIMELTGVGRNNTSKFLRGAGVTMRTSAQYDGAWNSKAGIDQAAARNLYEEGWTISRLAKRFGVGFGTMQRHLIESGAEMRPVSSVPTYVIKSPSAGTIRVRGSWEMAYARVLDIWISEGKIADWKYESEKIHLGSGRYYLPDFLVVNNSGQKVFHEVKGILHKQSAEKIQRARELGFRVVLIRRQMIMALQRFYGKALLLS